MGDAVAAGVAHLVFPGLFLYLLKLHGNASLYLVLLHLVISHEFDALHVSSQIVAGMFHVGSHAQVLLCLCVVQPVLSLYVVGFLLFCMESRCQQANLRVGRQHSLYAEGAEECAEDVSLLSVEVHFEMLDVLHRAERRLSV